MKVRKLLFAIILFVLFPLSVLAIEGTTGRTPIDSQIIDPFSVGSVTVNNISFTNYHNYNDTGVGGYTVLAGIHNYYTQDVELGWKFELYNLNGSVIDTREGTFAVPADEFYSLEISDALYPNVKGFSINDVKKFNLTITMITDVSVLTENTGNNSNYYLDKINVVMNVDRSNKINVDESLHLTLKKPLKYFERKMWN